MLPPFHTPHSTKSPGTRLRTTYSVAEHSAASRSDDVRVYGKTRSIVSNPRFLEIDGIVKSASLDEDEVVVTAASLYVDDEAVASKPPLAHGLQPPQRLH
jgi:hypothetical protein